MCAEPSCDRVVVARGYCKKHWQQVNRWGETRDSILRADPIVRLMDKVVVEQSGCWVWKGTTGRKGYGRIRIDNVLHQAHRASYELHVGKIPDGLVLDHLCRNTSCVNPSHLEPVTNLENMRRGIRATKRSCVHGHAYTAENTRIELRADGSHGKRICLTCRRETSRRWKERQRSLRTAEEIAEDQK